MSSAGGANNFFFPRERASFLDQRMAERGRSRFLRSECRRDGRYSASCRTSRPDAEASVDRRRRRSTERGGRFPRELRDAAEQRHQSSHRGREAPNAGTGRKLPETDAREGAVVDREANLPVRTADGGVDLVTVIPRTGRYEPLKTHEEDRYETMQLNSSGHGEGTWSRSRLLARSRG